jgi:hypothetical protein
MNRQVRARLMLRRNCFGVVGPTRITPEDKTKRETGRPGARPAGSYRHQAFADRVERGGPAQSAARRRSPAVTTSSARSGREPDPMQPASARFRSVMCWNAGTAPVT